MSGTSGDGFTFVAVGGDFDGRKFFTGTRPLDFAGDDAGEQLPFDLGGDAGISRGFPVGVPAEVHLQIHAGPDSVAGSTTGLADNNISTCVCAARAASAARRNRLPGRIRMYRTQVRCHRQGFI